MKFLFREFCILKISTDNIYNVVNFDGHFSHLTTTKKFLAKYQTFCFNPFLPNVPF